MRYMRNLGRSPSGTRAVSNARGTRCPYRQTCKSLLSVWKAQLWQENRQARSGSQIRVVEPDES